MPYRYFIRLGYLGTAYAGWQAQSNALTVQEVIENSMEKLLGTQVKLTGCGRTDTGVHAREYYAHFDTDRMFTSEGSEKFVGRINRILPGDISIDFIKPVFPGIHSRFSATKRQYQYRISRKKNPFTQGQSYYVYGHLDIDQMNLAAAMLKGHHNFRSFSKSGTQVKTFFCNVYEASWKECGEELIFTIEADRFLRNMVRAIVGTLLDVGRGKITCNDFANIMEQQDRSKAGYSVPAKALFLTGVWYPEKIYSDEPIFFSEQFPEKVESHNDTYAQFHGGTGDKSYE